MNIFIQLATIKETKQGTKTQIKNNIKLICVERISSILQKTVDKKQKIWVFLKEFFIYKHK